MDYRSDGANELPFRRMDEPTRIPFAEDDADTALLFAVLHHVDSEHLGPLLSDVHRVASRVIVREDVYDIPLHEPSAQRAARRDPLLREFVTLAPEEQKRVLILLDYFDNVLKRGIPEMNLPMQFKPVREWRRLFERHGFEHVNTVLIGFERGEQRTGTCHALLVFDAPPVGQGPPRPIASTATR